MRLSGNINIILIVLAFIQLFSSCVKIEPADRSESFSEIRFTSPVMTDATKAVPGVIDEEYPMTEKFTVYAKYSPSDFVSWDAGVTYIDAVEAAYDNSVNGWTTKKGSGGKTYYWPNSGNLTFAAYSPSSASEDMTSLTYGKEGFTFIDFTVESDPSQQYDLLYAPRAMNKTSSSVTSGLYDGVQLNFRHALSCIEFRVRNGSNFTSKIVLKGLKINNAYSKGTFEENIDTGNQATYNANPEWKDQAEVNDYTLPVVATGHIVTDDITEVQGCEPLLLIPQSFKHSETEHVKIQVTYSTDGGVDTEAEIDLVTGFDSDRDGHGDTYFNDGTNPIMSWEPGKKYIYTITFGQYKIFFTPSVETWEGGRTPPVYI